MPIIEFKKSVIESNINAVARAERVTKARLSSLSRELIAYVYETNDVAMVDRLLAVLTPANKRVAVAYFPNFLGWAFNVDTCTFGKKAKDKMYSKKLEDATEWLKGEANDIWVFEAGLHNPPPKKAKEYAKKITALATKALKDEKEGITAKELLFALLASEELSLGDLMQPLKDAVNDEPKEEDNDAV